MDSHQLPDKASGPPQPLPAQAVSDQRLFSEQLHSANPSAHARRLVREACSSWPSHRADDAELAVGELVANAVLHGKGPVAIRIVVDLNVLRVEVTDANPQHPRTLDPPPPSPEAEHGRGLYIVSAIADRWGSVTLDAGSHPGKAVWFELHRTVN
jgi:anti-sigma regulatory factor (Ser/Thr protein kinase)